MLQSLNIATIYEGILDQNVLNAKTIAKLSFRKNYIQLGTCHAQLKS
jgi:hypothetical protein